MTRLASDALDSNMKEAFGLCVVTSSRIHPEEIKRLAFLLIRPKIRVRPSCDAMVGLHAAS